MITRTELLVCSALFLLGLFFWCSGTDATLTQWLAAHQTPWGDAFWRVVGELGLGRYQIFLCLGMAWWMVYSRHSRAGGNSGSPLWTPVQQFFGTFYIWIRVLTFNTRPVTTPTHWLARQALVVQQLPYEARVWAYGIPVMFGAGAVCFVLKVLIGRARPKVLLWNDPAEYWHWGPELSGKYWSFPSGHTVTTFALCALLSCAYPRWRWLIWSLGTLTAMARVFAVTPHYFGDVLAGMAIGYGVGIVLTRRFDLDSRKRSNIELA